jgi:hypothetical protein
MHLSGRHSPGGFIMTATCTTTAGIFRTREDAERAVERLRAAGYEEGGISVIGRDCRTQNEQVEENVAEGAATGAAVGAMTGAGAMVLGSLAVSFGIIPVIGPVLAVGPLAAALISGTGGALAGAATGGLVGSLIGFGMSEDEAEFYESEVRAGRYLVAVECGQGDDARDILRDAGGKIR